MAHGLEVSMKLSSLMCCNLYKPLKIVDYDSFNEIVITDVLQHINF